MIRHAIAALVLVLAVGCGVSSEDAPEPIENTTDETPAGTPSVDTESRPAPPSTPPPTTTTTTPPMSTPIPTPTPVDNLRP